MSKTGLQALCLLGFSANRLIAERMLEMSGNADLIIENVALHSSLRDALLLVETLLLTTKDPNIKAQCQRCLKRGFKAIEGEE
jgi:tRNA C32,U32 (ribose-2'-O)-methylase TrmJ